ncbi:MAG: hypothetical protein WC663_00775 [Patescibacteria group bacterium]
MKNTINIVLGYFAMFLVVVIYILCFIIFYRLINVNLFSEILLFIPMLIVFSILFIIFVIIIGVPVILFYYYFVKKCDLCNKRGFVFAFETSDSEVPFSDPYLCYRCRSLRKQLRA